MLLLFNPAGTPPATSSFRCYINSLERDVAYGSLTITRQLMGRASAAMTLQIATSTGWRPYGGEDIAIYRGANELVFGGSITSITELMIGSAGSTWDPTDSIVQFQCQCVDYSSVFDRRLVAGKTYLAGSSLNLAVFDLWVSYLEPEGFSWWVGAVDNTTTLPGDAIFNTYQTVAQVFNQLATLTGCQWWTDAGKYLHFQKYDSSTAPAAPFDLTEWTDAYPANYRKLSVQRNASNYRNRQWVRTGLQIINTLEQTFIGNGITIYFAPLYLIQQLVSVTVDGVPKTFSSTWGTADFFYAPGTQSVINCLAPVLTPGQSLVITYNPPTSNVISAQNDTEIAARAAAEGGTGLHEAIDEAQNITTAAEAVAYCTGMLARFCVVRTTPTEIDFETDEQGVVPGQKMHVTHPGHAIDDDFIVQKTSETYVGLGLWRNQVSLVSAASPAHTTQTWNQYLGRVVEIARQGLDISQQVQSASTLYVYASWVLAEGSDAAVASDVANPVPIDVPAGYVATPQDVSIKAKAGNGPVGADFIADVLYHAPGGDGSGVSIFGTIKMVLPDGSTAVAVQTAFASPVPTFAPGGWLTADIVQVGTTTKGQNLSMTLRMTLAQGG